MELGFLVALVVALGVLGRDDDRGRRDRLAVLVAQRDLALGVGLEERRGAGMAVGGHALEDLVAVIERRRHQVGGLVAGEAEHDALVAGAFVLVARGVDALGDVRGLAVQMVLEARRSASGSRPARSRSA